MSKNFQTCMRCRRSSALKNVWVTTAYGGLAKESIHALKFGRAQSTAADIAQAMAIQLPAGLLVTHVPTATDRVRKRGYDQAQLMSNGIARLLSSPAIPLLARTGQQRQLGRGGGTRRKQMEGAFRALRPRRIHQADILLIDDVLTTGATLEAAALTLKAAGARQVYGAVFAQA
ncbi:MAG TPA: phosphoribosyltransferase family protein [Nevskiaceae bacterium]|nr:phosphoribosyltransferase family protein [Nevskiaceae bacterium]